MSVWGKMRLPGLVFLGISMLSCSKNSSTSSEADDGGTPYMVLDLSVTAVSDSTVTLSWTATGDDGDQGTANQYDIRYHNFWIAIENWNSATQISNEPTPRPAGQTETLTIGGLWKDSTYYFALRVSDEAGNWTNPSNCIRAVCFQDFVIAFPDPGLEAAVRNGIHKPSGDIMRSDLVGFAFLDGNGSDISDLSGLEYCIDLDKAYFAMNNISDLEPLADLTKIYDLQLFHNYIADISPLEAHLNMETLILRYNQVSDISVLSNFARLHLLNLQDNLVSDISPLVANAAFATGDTLYIFGNPLSGVSSDSLIPQLEARGVTVIW